ncbi:MAG: radical SAM protein [Lachnospiraceae bacterium]|nr:radical SAM protein [Lachnospiraceae bacterium]
MERTIEKIVIFGAGNVGRMALQIYKENVVYFIDNNEKLYNKTIDGLLIKSVTEFVGEKDKYRLVIASYNQKMMERQISELGITNYELFLEERHGYYETEELIFNPYIDNEQRLVTEQEYNENVEKSFLREAVRQEVDRIYGKQEIFSHIEIETVNRCNGNCDFCPVSKKNDTREYMKMSRQLFESIIEQLAEMDYSGKLALFSNNEPFLDDDIISKHKYARQRLPKARMHLFTNGTLLTLDKFIDIIPYLDELVIDNYQQELKLIKPCVEIVRYCEEHSELKKKVTIVLRKPHEILSSRGGDAPNREEMRTYPSDTCVLPFKQMIIRPDGKVSLCCCDPLGKNTLADLNKETLFEAWNNQRYKMVRECIQKGRKEWKHCEKCDYFSLG